MYVFKDLFEDMRMATNRKGNEVTKVTVISPELLKLTLKKIPSVQQKMVENTGNAIGEKRDEDMRKEYQTVVERVNRHV